MRTYRVEFHGSDSNWFFFGTTVTAASKGAAFRAAKNELYEARGTGSYCTCTMEVIA